MRNFRMTENSDINIFNVHYKTLELTNYETPKDRCTFYCINENIKDKDHLLDFYWFNFDGNTHILCEHIYWLSQNLYENKSAGSDAFEDIEKFIEQLNLDELNDFLNEINKWIDSGLDEDDFERKPQYYPYSGYDYAFYLFDGNSRNLHLFDHVDFDINEVAETLNIYIVEGDHPGSNYLGAELGISVDKANEIAKQKGFPVHFVKKS